MPARCSPGAGRSAGRHRLHRLQRRDLPEPRRGCSTQLDVPVGASDMSFGVSIDGGRVEYGARVAAGLFAQRRNLFAPRSCGCCATSCASTAAAEAMAAHRAARPRRAGRRAAARRWFRRLLPPADAAARSGRRRQSEIGSFPARSLGALLPQPRPAQRARPAPVVDGARAAAANMSAGWRGT